MTRSRNGSDCAQLAVQSVARAMADHSDGRSRSVSPAGENARPVTERTAATGADATGSSADGAASHASGESTTTGSASSVAVAAGHHPDAHATATGV